MKAAWLTVIVGVGVAGAWAVAMDRGMPGGDVSVLLAWAVGGAAVSGLLAAGLLRWLRPARLGVQAVVAALAPVLALTVGVLGAARAMFLSAHDLDALVVVVVGAGAVGMATALALGARVARASSSLGDLARRIGADGLDGTPPPPDGPASPVPALRGPGELNDLGAQLEAALARLAESRAQAAAVEDSRRELVAWVSHDLRTPLAGIRAMVEALEDGLVDDRETVARYYRTMRAEVERLAGLVDDLFELSRIHAGALPLRPERVTLDDLVSDALASMTPAATAKGVLLGGDVAAPSPVVELSVPEMSRVVRNLLDNAIRHTPPGGSVRVETAVDGRVVQVSVRDGCGGIPAADLPRVFELAFRGDSARTPGDGGAGLGLAVARGLVEAHEGDLQVENEHDGCRFTITLPLAAVGPAPSAPSGPGR